MEFYDELQVLMGNSIPAKKKNGRTFCDHFYTK